MDTKTCSKCHIEKPITEFNMRSRRTPRRRAHCKECGRAYQKKYRMGNDEERRKQRERYHDRIRRWPLYKTWQDMRQRCGNPKDKDYRYYGGRGISVCDQWLNSYHAFEKDMGPRPEGMSMDRIDNDGNYEPGNVRWATPKQQRANQRKMPKKA